MTKPVFSSVTQQGILGRAAQRDPIGGGEWEINAMNFASPCAIISVGK